MMKRVICIIAAFLACILLAGCGKTVSDRPGVVYQGRSVDDVLNDGIRDETAARQQTQALDAESKTKDSEAVPAEYQTVDIDLTKLNATMVYSEVYNMMTSPESYVGKKVRMKGTFTYFQGEDRYYFACLIADAAACCAQGIEFVLSGDKTFPNDYPLSGAQITVVGVFDTYFEDSDLYCQLSDAYIE